MEVLELTSALRVAKKLPLTPNACADQPLLALHNNDPKAAQAKEEEWKLAPTWTYYQLPTCIADNAEERRELRLGERNAEETEWKAN